VAPAPWRVIWSVTSDEIREKLPPWVYRDPAPGDVLISRWNAAGGREWEGEPSSSTLSRHVLPLSCVSKHMDAQEPILRHPAWPRTSRTAASIAFSRPSRHTSPSSASASAPIR